MNKSWGMLLKILSGEKVMESRWYKDRRAPWNRVTVGDTVYFKESGEPVTVKVTVTKVQQFKDLTPAKVQDLLDIYGEMLGIERGKTPKLYEHLKDKNYAILMSLSDTQKVKPFEIDKTGYGAMVAWITVENIEQIKK